MTGRENCTAEPMRRGRVGGMRRHTVKPVTPVGEGEWHWLQQLDRVELFHWTASSRIWAMARFPLFSSPEQIAREGWAYLSPVIIPEAPAPAQSVLKLAGPT